MEKIKYVKLEQPDGSYSNNIPLAVDADHVDVNGNTLTNVLGNKADNTDIDNLQTEINSLASGSPLVASSVSEMTDTSKVYVNTQDGHWYYYSGSEWADGGVYQATGISEDEQILIPQVTKVKKIEYTSKPFNEWSRYYMNSDQASALDNSVTNKITINTSNSFANNISVNNNFTDLEQRKLMFRFEFTVNALINNTDEIRIIINNTTISKILYLKDYTVGVSTKIEIPFNEELSTSTRLSVLLPAGKTCNVTLSNAIITNYIETPNNLEEILDDVNDSLDNINLTVNKLQNKEFVLPSKIPCVQELETAIFYDNVLLNTSIDNVERIEPVSNIGSNKNKLRDRWRILFDNTVSDATQYFKVYYDNNSEHNQQISVNLKVLSKSAGSGKTKKVLFIGDSLTDMNIYEQELKRMFSEDEMNIEFLGSRGTIETALHEGRSNWSMKEYCTVASFNNIDNAFWNPTTSKFDFSYYMQNQNYTDIDYVFINMGTNDMRNSNEETMQYYTEIVNSIKNYDSNIAVFIGLCPPLARKNDNITFKNKRIKLMKLLLAQYDNKENQKIFICPIVLNIDAENGFRTTVITGNRHEHENLEIVEDNTHPYYSEMYKMADTIYASIKYAVSLEE